jgi:FtsZ-interacting cell division protein ZipA
MKVSYFKKIEEGFFKDVYNQAFKGMSTDPKRDKKEIQNRTGPLFKTDFIKDLNADLAEALKNKAITIAPVTGSTTAQAQQQPQAAAPAQSQQQPQAAAPAQSQQQPQAAAPAQAQQQPQTAVQPTAQTRQDALQRVAQRKQQQQKAQTKPAKTKPVDREEDLEGVAVLGYNENIKFDMLNTLLESIISEQQKLHQISNGIK